MSFHSFETCAIEAMKAFSLKNEKGFPASAEIVKAYTNEKKQVDYFSIHCVLMLFMNDSLLSASQKISTQCKVATTSAEKFIMGALSAPGSFWWGQELLLYKKGLILSSKAYHLANVAARSGSDFDKCRKGVPAELMPILKTAIYYAHKKKVDGVHITPTVLKYMAFQLRAEGQEKKFMLSKFALTTSDYQTSLLLAAKAIKAIAGALKIPVPETLIIPTVSPPSPPLPKQEAPSPRRPAAPAGAATPVLNMWAAEEKSLPAMPVSSLEKLRNKGVITSPEITIYQWLSTKSEGGRTIAQASARFQRPFNEIQDLLARVGSASKDGEAMLATTPLPSAARHPSIKAHSE